MILTIDGTPMSKQSFRYTRSGRRYQPKANDQARLELEILSQLPQGWKPWTGPVCVRQILYVFPIPQSMPKNLRVRVERGPIPVYRIRKPDLTDNLNKGLFDAMSGLVYLDDKQICVLGHAVKIYGVEPRTVIQIEEMNHENGQALHF